MSSESEDLQPLINRVRKQTGSKAAPIPIDSDSDDSLPSWIKNYTTPGEKRAAISSDSDSGTKKRAKHEKQSNGAAGSSKRKLQNGASSGAAAPAAPARQAGVEETTAAADEAGPNVAATPVPGASRANQAIAQAPNELHVLLPEKLPRTKLLVELESDSTGATDLTGDAGAVGRLLVSGAQGQEDIGIDLKGVLYQATVVQLPGTVCIVNAAGGTGEAKVESIFSDMLQLRPDASNDLARQEQGLFDALMLDDDDNDAGPGPTVAASEGPQAPGKGAAKAGKPHKKGADKGTGQPTSKRKTKPALAQRNGGVKKKKK